MNSVITGLTSTFGLIIFIFLIVLAVLWFILPFSIFGIKPLIRDIQATQKETIEQLRRLDVRYTGKTKKCPDCAEFIKTEATVCRYCQHEFLTTNAQSGPTTKETASTPTDIITCAACEKETHAGQNICPHCNMALFPKGA